MVTRTINALYEVIKQEQFLAIQKEVYYRMLTLSKIIKVKEEKDLSDGSELVKIQTELQSTEDAILAIETKLKESQDVVREILVLDIGQCFVIDVPLVYGPSQMDCDAAIDTALLYRTEIEQSCDEYNEKLRLSKVAKQNVKPDLDLVLKYNNSGYDRYFRNIDKKPEAKWTVSLETKGDFDMASEKVAYDQSLLAVQSACTSVDQAKEKVVLEVKRAFRTLNRASENIQFQEKKIKQLQGERKLLIRKYEKGLTKNSDIMQADKNISSANAALVTAIIEHITGEFSLKSAMGLLIEKPIVNC